MEEFVLHEEMNVHRGFQCSKTDFLTDRPLDMLIPYAKVFNYENVFVVRPFRNLQPERD